MISLFYYIPNSTTTTPHKVGEAEIADYMIQLDPMTLKPTINLHNYHVSLDEFFPVEIKKIEDNAFTTLEIEWMVGQVKNLMLNTPMIWKKSLVKLPDSADFFVSESRELTAPSSTEHPTEHPAEQHEISKPDRKSVV